MIFFLLYGTDSDVTLNVIFFLNICEGMFTVSNFGSIYSVYMRVVWFRLYGSSCPGFPYHELHSIQIRSKFDLYPNTSPRLQQVVIVFMANTYHIFSNILERFSLFKCWFNSINTNFCLVLNEQVYFPARYHRSTLP